jgi:hypothetical protein
VSTRPGPNGRARPSLGDQLDRLDGILNGLSDALNESVTAAVAAAVGRAVHEAVEAACELVARSAPPAVVITETTLTGKRRLGRRLWARVRAAPQLAFTSVGRGAGRLVRRLRAPLVGLLHWGVRARWLLIASAVAGVAAGTAAGFGGPLVGAALGALAGFAIAFNAAPAD